MKFLKYILFLSIVFSTFSYAQKNLIYVDDQGIMRWTETNLPAYFWGVNYSTPFAFSYRAIEKAGLKHEEVIDNDIQQFKRLKLNAYRIHVWDREVSDRLGNLIDNEHIRLLDYLIAKLIENDIYVILTPIAWWGTGYPEPDLNTEGFSSFASKIELTTKQELIDVQKNYLKQFLNHVNKYTNKTYKDEPKIIAFEVINEPNLASESEKVTDYVNQTVDAIRSTGTTKPVFFNISENPGKSEWIGVANSNIQGISFQWYPTGLVKTNSLEGNYLPHVSSYLLPDYTEKINTKAKMVYEFDAADVAQPVMYPVMANSLKKAGMQWATMFCYDPTPIAGNNAEYITHYLNLVFTPSKAISYFIAGELFRNNTHLQFNNKNVSEGVYVNYEKQLSLLNDDQNYFYSNSTEILPVKPAELTHIAGVGNSPLIQYEGRGSYFLDKIETGLWQLEVFPDAVWLKDPFGINNLTDEVAELIWNPRRMRISLPDLEGDIFIYAAKDNLNYTLHATGDQMELEPGTYMLSNKKVQKPGELFNSRFDFDNLRKITKYNRERIEIKNLTPKSIYTTDNKEIRAEVISHSDSLGVTLFIRKSGWRRAQEIKMKRNGIYLYSAKIPVDLAHPGVIEYFITVSDGRDLLTFPGRYKTDPNFWGFNADQGYELVIKPDSDSRVIFDPKTETKNIIFPNIWSSLRFRNDLIPDSEGNYSYSIKYGEYKKPLEEIALQVYVGDNTEEYEWSDISEIQIDADIQSDVIDSVQIRLIFSNTDGIVQNFSKNDLGSGKKITITKPGKIKYALLPRPYPTFLPYWYETSDELVNEQTGDKLEFIQIALPLKNAEIDQDLNTRLSIGKIKIELAQKGN